MIQEKTEEEGHEAGKLERQRPAVMLDQGLSGICEAGGPGHCVPAGDETIVTNGDQTDTVYEGREKGLTFEESLRSREFEPDGPNYTPRISGLMKIKDGTFHYAMSILKSNNGNPESCNRFTYTYENPIAGEGRFIHTYMHDGNPLPSFEGEPKLVVIEEDIDDFTNTLWNSLNDDNKVSLFVRYIDIATGEYETRIVNKNK